ncbi:MAG: hypothetical protein WA862_09195, partial [Solirubrobacterales bacterium]
VAPGGSILIADPGDVTENDGRVRRVSPQGGIETVLAAGSGSLTDTGFDPAGIAALGPSSFVVGDDHLDAVYVDGGRIAGGSADDHDPEEGDSNGEGEGGACDASLEVVDLDYAGPWVPGPDLPALPSYLLVDRYTNQEPGPDGRPSRVLALRPAAFIAGCSKYYFARVAGGGPGPPPATGIAPSGDGQAATDVYMNDISAVVSLHGMGGGFLVATVGDGGPADCRVRRVSAAGTVTTLAGTGVCASGADGGAAAATPIDTPGDLAAMPDGSILLIEGYPERRLRRIAPDGTIETVQATNPFGGFDFPFGHIPFPEAAGLAASPDGSALVASAPADPSRGGRVVRLGGDPASPPQQQPKGTGHAGGEGAAPPPQPSPLPRRLKVSLARSAYSVVTGGRLALRVDASVAAGYRLTLKKGGAVRLSKRGRVAAGMRKLRLRIGLPPGRYRLALELTGAGQRATDTASLTVRPTHPGARPSSR